VLLFLDRSSRVSSSAFVTCNTFLPFVAFFVLRDFSSARNETLAQYYIRLHENLIPTGVEFWELDEVTGNVLRWPPIARMSNRTSLLVLRSPLILGRQQPASRRLVAR
jgi:hypothetical protein